MVAFCGMMAALSIVIMLIGSVFSLAVYIVPLFCGLLLLPVAIEYGRKTGWMMYIAVCLLGLFLGFDKEAVFFYIFTCWYPLCKYQLDNIRPRLVNILIKVAIFTVAIIAMYSILIFVLGLQAIANEFSEMGPYMGILFIVLFDISMLLYDRMMVLMTLLYAQRIRPKLKFLNR